MSQKPIVQRKSLSVATESELTMKARIIVDSVELNLKKIPVSQDGGYRRAADFATDRILHYRRLYGGVWSRSRSNRVLWRCWRPLICWILRPNEPITPIQKSPWLGCVRMPRRSWSSTKPS